MTNAQTTYRALLEFEIYGRRLLPTEREGAQSELHRITAKMKQINGQEHKLEKRYRAMLRTLPAPNQGK